MSKGKPITITSNSANRRPIKRDQDKETNHLQQQSDSKIKINQKARARRRKIPAWQVINSQKVKNKQTKSRPIP